MAEIKWINTLNINGVEYFINRGDPTTYKMQPPLTQIVATATINKYFEVGGNNPAVLAFNITIQAELTKQNDYLYEVVFTPTLNSSELYYYWVYYDHDAKWYTHTNAYSDRVWNVNTSEDIAFTGTSSSFNSILTNAGIKVNINIKQNNTDEYTFYVWDFNPCEVKLKANASRLYSSWSDVPIIRTTFPRPPTSTIDSRAKTYGSISISTPITTVYIPH